jgi:hypothetical protein
MSLSWEKKGNTTWTAKRPDGIKLTLSIEVDHVPVEGSAMASGDDEADREYERAIIERLDAWDTWAWASVKVEAFLLGEEGVAYLGCCSYEGFEEFAQPDGYLPSMIEEAIAELREGLEALQEAATEAASWLKEHEGGET